MFSFFKKLFDYNQKEIDRLRKIVIEINAQEDRARALKNEEFAHETITLKDEIQSKRKKLDDILPWTYALVRESARRILGERHFDEQLMAGVALHEGKVVEQKTGEGKTLSSTAPLYLNALSGKGTHLVTVNDYLARRDAGWMGQVFHMLGLSVSAIISDRSFLYDPDFTDDTATDWRLRNLREISRKEAYEADITYGINSEFGFDYLRDNMATSTKELKQRDFHYAIIDEVDSVLIDEARTPHIISAPYDEDTTKYYQYAKIVNQLDVVSDYVIDEKLHTAHLTEGGISKIEQLTGVPNIYEKDFDSLFHIEAALKAQTLFKKDKEYIVANNEVVIVDEFTGRLLHGRRFSEGLHQAIEAKENVSIKRESKTLATVSLQNYFRMYDKLAGMTGTAATEAEEFHKIYKLEVITIPTHRPLVRKDNSDIIYKTEKGKFSALVEEIAQQYKTGRPILVGTTAIDKNELLSSLLKRKGIPHEMLNAKNHEREAYIISNAGRKNAVTVATNMAGRGVDIILGGQPPSKFKVQSQPRFNAADGIQSGLKIIEDNYEKEIKKWRKDHDEVVSFGGLYVMGTERHESRRIDNQLRGRSGRQGDPGETRFFVSLEDEMMRIFGGEQVSKLMTFFKIPEDQPLEHTIVSKALEQAQVKVEGFNFDIRKHLVDFDDVLNKQREILYKQRKNILSAGTYDSYEVFTEKIYTLFKEEVAHIVTNHSVGLDEPRLDEMIDEYLTIVPAEKESLQSKIKDVEVDKISEILENEFEHIYSSKEQIIGKDLWLEIVKNIYLSTIDTYWTEHLTAIEDLREGINLRGYGQLDPLVEYKNEAYTMFEKLLSNIEYDFSRRILRIEVSQDTSPVQKKSRSSQLHYHSASTVNPFRLGESSQGGMSQTVQQPKKLTPHVSPQKAPSSHEFKITPPGTQKKKISRNDPCWCGSGKKYKKCHLNKE